MNGPLVNKLQIKRNSQLKLTHHSSLLEDISCVMCILEQMKMKIFISHSILANVRFYQSIGNFYSPSNKWIPNKKAVYFPPFLPFHPPHWWHQFNFKDWNGTFSIGLGYPPWMESDNTHGKQSTCPCSHLFFDGIHRTKNLHSKNSLSYTVLIQVFQAALA